jgi:hypothetical protein
MEPLIAPLIAPLIDPLLLWLGLATLGAHVTVPWRLAGAPAELRRRWQLMALPALWTGLLAFFAGLLLHPDRAVAGGLATFPGGNAFSRLLSGLFLAAAALDLLLLVAGHRFGDARRSAAGWRLAGAAAVPLLIAYCLAAEVVRVGEGPLGEPLLVWPAVLARGALALSAGELWLPGRPPWGSHFRPLWSPVAALALPVYFLALPPPVRFGLVELGLPVTLTAAGLLLVAARWLPARYRKAALAAGLLLAAIVLSQAAALSEALSGALV